VKYTMSHVKTLIKIAITTAMTSLLISGVQLSESNIYANSEAPSMETPNHNGHHKHHHHHGGITKDAAHLLGMESHELLKEWQKGKTLVQIAQDRKGWSEETFTKKLCDIEMKKIDAAIKAGKVSKEKGDTIKRKLPEKLKNALNHKHGNHHDRQPGTFSHL
jgi:hypothetical protein